MNPIDGFRGLAPIQPPQGLGNAAAAAGGEGSFKDFLLDSIHQLNTMQRDADRAVEQLAAGADVSPAEVLTAVQRADIAFQLMMQVQDKMVQAYNDVQSIRV